MDNLSKLELALLEGDVDKASNYLQEIDRRTANEAFKKAGEQFGFSTVEIFGTTIAHMGMVSKILGYTDPSGLSKLLDRWQIYTTKIGSYGHDVRIKIRKSLGVDPRDSHATFISWDGFLIAGIYGQNEEARKVKAYLLKMEAIGRVALADDPRYELAAKNYELRRLEKQINFAIKIDKMGDSPYKDSCIEDLEKLTGRKFPRSAQVHLFEHPLEKKKQ